MALLHHATLTPTKDELLAGWVPRQPWAAGLPELARFGGFRLDDPEGEVGLEGILMRSADGSVVVHVPLTYRGAPLDGAEEHLVGTTEHGVLGTRWVYDGAADPVFLLAFATMAVDEGAGAEEFFVVDGQKHVREPSVTVSGSGTSLPAGTYDDVAITIQRVAGQMPDHHAGDAVVTGRWDGGSGVIGYVRAG